MLICGPDCCGPEMLALKDLKVTNRHFTKLAGGLKPWQTKAANQSKEIFKLQRERVGEGEI